MLSQCKEYFFNVYAANVVFHITAFLILHLFILLSLCNLMLLDDIDSKKTTVKRKNLITQVNWSVLPPLLNSALFRVTRHFLSVFIFLFACAKGRIQFIGKQNSPAFKQSHRLRRYK